MSGGNHHAFATGSSGMMGRTMVDFGTLGGTNSSAYCINDAGTVVGTTQMGSGLYHAFMVTNALGGMARMLDLNALIPTNSGWQLIEARGINMLGQIIGWGMRSGHTNAFLLTPVSGPSIVTATPTPAIVGPGAMVTLQIQMNASDPLNYQWLHNGMPMPTATNSTLSWSGIMGANVGSYTVTVRNAIGTVGIASTSVSLFGMQARNGKPQLMLAGPTGTQFRIDATETLGLGAGWQTMTNFIMTGSMIQLIAAPPGDLKPRFYRASLVQ
jgi:probable HAF family extracellular repeat protein